MRNMMRLGAVLLVVLVLLIGASTLWAAGEDPASAVLLNVSTTETCTAAVTLQPGASMWVKIPYTAGNDVELYAKGSAILDFGVYFGDQSGVPGYPSLGNPVGRLTPNPNEPGFLASWRGHVGIGNLNGFIYVLIKNTNSFPVTFSLCSIQNGQFFPPAYVPVEPPCIHIIFNGDAPTVGIICCEESTTAPAPCVP